MKYSTFACFACCAAFVSPAMAWDAAPEPAKTDPPAEEAAAKADADPAKVLAKHKEGSGEVADKQDDLSADVQQLTIEQTQPKVIELLESVETIMDDAIDWLLEHDTGGRTIAAQTEVIEKIFEAAKQRQQKSGSCDSSGAMMDMMEKMMQRDEGKEPGQKEGDKKGDKPGDKGGGGKTGTDADPSGTADGTSDAKSETRRVPRAGGSSGAPLPEEFRRALDAYNRGLGNKDK